MEAVVDWRGRWGFELQAEVLAVTDHGSNGRETSGKHELHES